MKNNETFLEFHTNLMGFVLKRKGSIIPKFIAYWSGISSEKIRQGKLKIKAIKKN